MAITARRHDLPETAGIGLRLPHLAEVVATRPAVGWLEVHPENFMVSPHAMELLVDLAHDYPISVHTVGVSIGSADGVDRTHLQRLRKFVDAIDPILVSGHLAWSTHQGEYLNDLLPLPYCDETLDVVAAHLDEVQCVLGRAYLVENPSSYLGFTMSTMTEAQFLNELVFRTGCRLLCDVSNVYLSAHNMGFDAMRFIDSLPPAAIGELHLGGFTAEDDSATDGGMLLVDTHASSIASPVWGLYEHTIRRVGRKPTIVEWDADIPPLAVLQGEAAKADVVAAATSSPDEASHARAL